jgi:hypothetical protein
MDNVNASVLLGSGPMEIVGYHRAGSTSLRQALRPGYGADRSVEEEPHLGPQYERITARGRRAQALTFQRDHLGELGAGRVHDDGGPQGP